MKGLLDTLLKPFYLIRGDCRQGKEEKPKALTLIFVIGLLTLISFPAYSSPEIGT